jgi:transketolase
MRSLPNMMVICPADHIEARKATQALAKTGKPGYMRLSRDKVSVVTSNETPFEIGRAEIYTEGQDVAVIACGQMVYRALLTAKELKSHKIDVRVINCHTIKPLDEKTILKAAEECGALVTAEEHQVTGGLGGAVAELLSQNYPVPLKIIGVEDRFGESGEPNELLEKFGLTVEAISKAITQVLRMKDKS